eukprot:gene21879-50587_t
MRGDSSYIPPSSGIPAPNGPALPHPAAGRPGRLQLPEVTKERVQNLIVFDCSRYDLGTKLGEG